MKSPFPLISRILPYTLKGNRLFYKYLFTHLLSMVVPLLIILLVFNLSFVKLVREQSVETEKKNLALIMEEVDGTVMQLHRLKEQIQLNKRLRPFRFINNPLQGGIIVGELANYVMMDFSAEGIILDYKIEEKFIFTEQTTMEKETLPYHGALPPPLNWESLLNTGSNYILPLESFRYFEKEMGPVILFSYPLYNVKSYGTVVFIVPEENVISRIPLVTNRRATLTIRDGDYPGAPLILNASSEEGIGKNPLVLREQSSETGLVYELSLSRDMIFAPVTVVTRLIIGVIVAILVVGAGIAAAGSVWNYRRLDQLKKSLEEFSPDRESADVLDHIGHSLDEISRQLKESRRALGESRIRRLLRGEEIDGDEVDKKGERFSVAVLKLPSSARGSRQEVIEKAESYPCEEWALNAVSDILTGRILLLINYGDSLDPEILRKQTEELFASLRNSVHGEMTMGLSRSGRGREILPELKEEAIRGGEMSFLGGSGRLYRGKTDKSAPGSRAYPTALLQNYRTSLQSKDGAGAEKLIGKIIGYIKGNDLSLYAAKGICYELISIILISLSSRPGEFRSQDSLQSLDIGQFGTIDSFGDFLKRFIKENLTREGERKSHPMTDYIGENFQDVNFSLTQMGDAFDLTVPNLCHIFKEEVGTTVLDYTSRLRMENARKLLETAKMTVGEIALESGYANANSFIRRFRQLNGMSPGEYRKNLKNTPRK